MKTAVLRPARRVISPHAPLTVEAAQRRLTIFSAFFQSGNAAFVSDMQINEMLDLRIKVIEPFVDGSELMPVLQPNKQNADSDRQAAQESRSNFVHVFLQAVDYRWGDCR
jgi:hypothetical protein